MTPVELLLSKLPDAKRNGQGWQARCPAHDDRRPSLSIAEGDDGRALVNCHAGCTSQAIVESVGLNLADLMPAPVRVESAKGNGRPNRSRRRERTSARAAAVDWSAVADRCRTALADDRLASLATDLGVSIEALRGIGVGYADAAKLRELRAGGDGWADNPPTEAFTFPERSGDSRIVGLSLRTPDGRKGFPAGAKRGLIVPATLHDLANAGSPLLVVEGASDVAAALTLGLQAVGRPSNCGGAADLAQRLRGREVLIVGERDEKADGRWPGRDGAVRVAQSLALAWQRKVSWTLPSDDSKDVRSWLQQRVAEGLDLSNAAACPAAGHEMIEDLVGRAESVLVPSDIPKELTQARVESFQPFPVEALPKPVADFVKDSAEAIGCDPSFIALPLLAGFASAIGNSRRIQLKRGWTEPAVLWGAIIGESGSTKSPALELAFRALRQRQERKMKEHRAAFDQYQKDHEIFEAHKAAWKRNAAKNPTAAGDPPEVPVAPTCERCWTDDVTIEALAKLLQDNPHGMLVIRDELSGWLHFDRYSANGKGGEAAKWLEMFGGRALVVDRKTSGTIYVPHAAVSIVGGIQPGILARYIGQEHRDNGLLPRLLLTMPPRRKRVWTEADIDPKAEATITAIFEALQDLTPARNADGDPRPAILQLTAGGKRAWIAFYNEHNAEAADLCGDLAAAWSKLEGYAARLALVHHLIRQASGEEVGGGIDAVSVEAGIKLSRWFANEARRVYAMLAEDDDARQRRQSVELIQRKGGSVTVRDWQRTRSHRTAEDAEAELAQLVAAGVGRWEEAAPGPNGGRPSKRFILNDPVERASDDSEAKEEPEGNPADDDWGEL